MVLLNGEVEGVFSGPITHSPAYQEDSSSDDGYARQGVNFYNIIYTLVKEFGALPANKIIIDDVDLRVKNVIRYTPKTDEAKTFWIYPNKGVDGGWSYSETEPGGLDNADNYKYTIGDSIGYQYTDFIYPLEKDLTSSVGESIESVLKKIA
jgi:hypothetical protein